MGWFLKQAFMQLQPSNACTGPVVTCFYHRLIQALRWHWDQRASDESLSTSSMGKCDYNLYDFVAVIVCPIQYRRASFVDDSPFL